MKSQNRFLYIYRHNDFYKLNYCTRCKWISNSNDSIDNLHLHIENFRKKKLNFRLKKNKFYEILNKEKKA